MSADRPVPAPLTRRYVRGLPTHDRPLVLGIVNVTPDSFSDGGRYVDPQAATAHALALVEEGADLVDVGGESTRPGATRPTVEEELERVLPVISHLADRGIDVSVDTMRARVAQEALASGARLVNDVSGGLADPDMLAVVAAAGAPYVITHWRGHADVMQQQATYDDVVQQVREELAARVEAALTAGIAADRIVVDPGLGFAKGADHNWELLSRLEELDLGLPLLLGSSRKTFLGALLAGPDGPRPVLEREAANVALTTLAALSGVWAVRVHRPRPSRDAIRVVQRWRQPGSVEADHD